MRSTQSIVPTLALLALVLAALIGAACEEDGDEATATASSTGEREQTSSFVLPESSLRASLWDAWSCMESSACRPASDDELLVPKNTVDAVWFVAGGQYVVHYDGIEPGQHPLCAVTSLVGSTEQHHSSLVASFHGAAPTVEGACGAAQEGWLPASSGVRAHDCDGELLVLTAIPQELDEPLNLEASLGFGTGLSHPSGRSQFATLVYVKIPAPTDAPPEVDLSSCTVLPG